MLRVLDIDSLYKKQAICFIFKNNLFNIKNLTYNLRKTNLEIPFVVTKKASMSFLQVGLRSLNEIPKELLIISNYSYFKYKLKNWFYTNL